MSLQVSSTTMPAVSQNSTIGNWQQRRQDFEQLTQALQSGDLKAAQSAYSTLTKDFPNIASNPNSPLAQVGQALHSGNVSAAQSAFASMHHHHHHSVNSAPAVATDTLSSSDATSDSATVGTLLNAVA